METRGKIILISLFILTIFFTGCKKGEFFETKKESINQSHYDNFKKEKKEKLKNQSTDVGCTANENESYQGHGRKITICHNGHMITISVNAVLKHFNNHSADRLFTCEGENSVAYSDIECTLKHIMAVKNLNPNSRHSLQRAFNVWIDEYFLAGRWPADKVSCDGTPDPGTGTGGETTDPGTGTGGGTTDPGTGGGTTDTTTTGGGTTDPGTGTDSGTGTDGGTTTDTTPAEPTMPVCHNGAILNEDYLTAYVYAQEGDLLIACEYAAGAVSFYDIEGPLLDIIYDYGLDSTAPDVMFQAFVIWYEDYYLTGNWPLDGGGGGAGDGGSGTGSDGEVIISN